MITEIRGYDFKGLSFHEKLSSKNLIIGLNETGKSARIQALFIAAMGYVPGTDKRIPEILDAFGNGDSFQASLVIKNEHLDKEQNFTRKFAREKGKVSQFFMIDGGKASKTKFIGDLNKMGGVAIFDLNTFMDLSDNGRIDMIFQLFPPAGNIKKMNNDIDKNSKKLNAVYKEIRDTENFIQKLSVARAELELPAGTHAEVSNNIKTLENELSAAQEDLKKAELELDREEQQKKAQKAEMIVTKETGVHIQEKPFLVSENKDTPKNSQSKFVPSAQQAALLGPTTTIEFAERVVESIQMIIDTIKEVNCPVCSKGAALLVAKRELKKYTNSEG